MKGMKGEKVWTLGLLVFFLTFGPFFPSLGYSDARKVITLKMADSFPLGHPAHKMSLRLIQNIEKYTDGKVKIEHYPAEQLGKMKDLPNLCKLGVTDIAYMAPSFHVGSVPLNTVMILPFWTTAMEGTRIYQRLIDLSPPLRKEFLNNGYRPMAVQTISQYDIGTVDREVRSPEDVKGLRLKSSGGLYERIAKRFDIIPTTISSPEVYEAMQRGIVKGAIFSLPSVKGYRLNEIEKYHTLGLRLGGYPATYVINNKVWNGLPQDLQARITKASKEASLWFAQVWDQLQLNLAKVFEKGGMKIYYVTPEDRARWDEKVRGIENEWIEFAENRGLPGRQVFEQFKTICLELAK